MIEPRRVIIVGNGASAWMTAACLNAAVNDGDFRPADITVVGKEATKEEPGWESALPELRQLVAVAGISEVEFLQRVGGTFSHAIRFDDWQENAPWYHAFDHHRPGPIDTSGSNWLSSDHAVPFAETVSSQPALCDAGISALPLPGVSEFPRLNYGYHCDETRLADVFREVAIARSVQHVTDECAAVERGDNGDIVAVNTAGGATVAGDLFVDCTGPEARLISGKLGVPFINSAQWLICDRVASIDIPYQQHYPGKVRPFTLVTAVPSGYIREIPLQDRRILQHIYAADINDANTVEQELRQHAGPAAPQLDVRHQTFASGHRAKPWVGNCVAIGSAFASVDPVASAAPSLGAFGINMLIEHIPLLGDMDPLAYRYNRILADLFYESLDFVELHYRLSARHEPFWREVTAPARRIERLTAKLDFWRKKPPAAPDFEDPHFAGGPPLPDGGLPGDHRAACDTGKLFGLSSYEMLLYGAGFPGYANSAGQSRSQVLDSVTAQLQQARASLPRHEQWLQTVCGMPDYNS